MKRGKEFLEYVESVGQQLGVPATCVTREEILTSKTGQLCAPIHEGCLRRVVLAMVKVQREAALRNKDKIRFGLAEELFLRYKEAPKENLIAYLCGFAEAARITEKKALYQTLERIGKVCHLNTH